MTKGIIAVALGIFFSGILTAEQGRGSADIYFAGDMTLRDSFFAESPTRTFTSDLTFIDKADGFIANLEMPITDHKVKIRKEFNFRLSTQYKHFLKLNRISAVNIANNHVFDYGETGFFDTIESLKSEEIGYFGAGINSKKAYLPYYLSTKGIKIAFFGCGGYAAPRKGENRPALCGCDEELMKKIKETKKDVDYVIVNIHWGVEDTFYPGNNQKALARRLIDEGTDVIIGHHPHVVQGFERYKDGLIAYSIGNFLFMSGKQRENVHIILKLRLSKDKFDYHILPIEFENHNARLAGDMRKQIVLQVIKERSTP